MGEERNGMMKNIHLPLDKVQAQELRAGDVVTLSGVIYTARDAAHKRMVQEFEEKGSFPFDLEGQVIYYAGPAPAKPGDVIGSVGPTTSYRMDAYAPLLIQEGQRGMIGKGKRSQEVIDAMTAYGAVYFGATGGAGALLASHIQSSEMVAYEDLGAEAIRKLTIEKFPAIVIIDAMGNNLYESEPTKYKIDR